MTVNQTTTPAADCAVIPFPLPKPPYRRDRLAWLRDDAVLPENVRWLYKPRRRQLPEPLVPTGERVLLRVIVDALTPAAKRKVLRALDRAIHTQRPVLPTFVAIEIATDLCLR